MVNAQFHSQLFPVHPPSLDYTMQKICSDIANYKVNIYIMIVDRFSNQVSVYKFTKAEGVINALRHHFRVHGVLVKLSLDGGPKHSAIEIKEFFVQWGVSHRLSSSYNPRANLRAELEVKIAKSLLRDNTRTGGTLDTHKVIKTLLQ